MAGWCKCGALTVRRGGCAVCAYNAEAQRVRPSRAGRPPLRRCDYCGAGTRATDADGAPACSKGHGCMVRQRELPRLAIDHAR